MGQEKDMKERTSPKVKAMYDAVLQLLIEDYDLEKIKVSDITDRAGIGKGTAYQYFENREDLISSAIAYIIGSWMKDINERMAQKDSVYEGIAYLFNQLEEYIHGDMSHVFARVTMMSMMANPDSLLSRQIHTKMHQLMPVGESNDICERGIWQGGYELVAQGMESGEMKCGYPTEYVVYTISCKFMMYVLYCIKAQALSLEKCPHNMMKDLLLKSIHDEFFVS